MGDRVAGRVAIVTGGGRGIGRAVALALASEGAHVAVFDVDGAAAESVAAEVRSRGRRSSVEVADVSDGEAITLAVARAARDLGPVDVLINNAGAGHDDVRFVDLPPASWRPVIDVCVYGTLQVTRAVLPSMMARRSGRIVNLSSELALVGSSHAAVYATAKAAILGFTRSVARDIAGSRVTVNAVCPGDVDTERSRENEATRERTMTPAEIAERRRQRDGRVPLGRPGRPEEVAGVILFLCSDEASYVTGQTLMVNGGSFML
jgi:2-hydroxycyclohexanecarboxyl-CoA dehydrogenase